MVEPAVLQSLLVILAAAAALARGADGDLAIPLWLACALQTPALLLHMGNLRTRGRWTGDHGILAVLLAAGIAVAVHHRNVDAFFLCTTNYLAGRLLLQVCTALAMRLDRAMDAPTQLVRILIVPWLILILVATVVLALPIATQSGVPDYRHNFWLHVSNCFFSAASAASLVGTSVYGFGEDFSHFGQVVLMLETQLCGMAFAAMGLAVVRPTLLRSVSLRTVWLTCLGLEAAGMLLMVGQWQQADAHTKTAQAGWSAIYAINAVFNSGFTMKASGLADYLGQPRIFASITVLVILGSLGLPIVLDLLLVRRPADDPRRLRTGPWMRLASWEAGITFMLLLAVAGILFLCETPRLLPEHLTPDRPLDMGSRLVPMRDLTNHVERWRTAVFVSATVRSAGLQSIPIAVGALSWPSIGALVFAMIVGGSAGGAGGGFRTTAFTLILLALFYGRTAWSAHPRGAGVRGQIVGRLSLFAGGWLAMNACGVMLLAAATQGSWYEWTIDGVAALNNVALSTGLSLHLTPAGRLTMIGLMMLGRWVPLLFWLRMSATILSTAPERRIGSVEHR